MSFALPLFLLKGERTIEVCFPGLKLVTETLWVVVESVIPGTHVVLRI